MKRFSKKIIDIENQSKLSKVKGFFIGTVIGLGSLVGFSDNIHANNFNNTKIVVNAVEISIEEEKNQILDQLVNKDLDKALEKINDVLSNLDDSNLALKKEFLAYKESILGVKNKGLEFFVTKKGLELIQLYNDDEIFFEISYVAATKEPNFLRDYLLNKVFEYNETIEVVITNPQEVKEVTEAELNELTENSSRNVIVSLRPYIMSINDQNLFNLYYLRVNHNNRYH